MRNLNRRSFLKTGLALGVAPHIGFGKGVGGKPALAMIGVGLQGRGLMHGFLGQDLVVRAVCDCDRVRREDRTRVANDYYASRPQLGIPADACRAVADFREILSDPSIDMVCIATPDHWHAYMAVEAMKAGKDVYCEKPLTYTIAEAKAVMAAEGTYKRILQTGAMQRSGVEFRTACEIVRNGGIGTVKFVDANYGGPSRPHRDYENPANAAVEGAPNPDVDFDMWCGGAPLVTYSDRLAPRGVHTTYSMFWRFDDYFGLGMCGDWGAHHLDIVQWALDMDATGPVKVLRSDAPPSTHPFDGGRRQRGMSFVCADGCVIRHNPYGGGSWGAVFYGTEGIVAVNRGCLAVWRGTGVVPDAALQTKLADGSFDGMTRVAFWNTLYDVATRQHVPRPGGDKSMLDAVNKATKAFGLRKAKVKLYRSLGHVANFVDCCRTRKPTISNAAVGGRSAILANLCNLSYVHDTGFDWDPAQNVFAQGTGDAAWLARRAYRKGWDVKI